MSVSALLLLNVIQYVKGLLEHFQKNCFGQLYYLGNSRIIGLQQEPNLVVVVVLVIVVVVVIIVVVVVTVVVVVAKVIVVVVVIIIVVVCT